MVKIALVDSGIDTNFFKNKITDGIFIDNNLESAIEIKSDINDYCAHGSQCASVILKECPEALLHIVKVFGENLTTKYDTLLYALEYLLDVDVDIINFSLSAKADNNVYRKIINITEKLHAQGKEIFWAIKNKENPNPEFLNDSFWNVGVDDSVEEFYIDEKQHCIYVNTLPYLHYYINNEYRLFGSSTSYATAKAAGKFAEYIDSGSRDAEKRFIEKYSEYKKYIPSEYKDNTINYNTKLFRVLLDIIKEYFRSVDESTILKYSLFSSKISCHDDFCYELLRKIENRLKISLQPYQTFSKLDFVSVFSLYKRLLETNVTEGVY